MSHRVTTRQSRALSTVTPNPCFMESVTTGGVSRQILAKGPRSIWCYSLSLPLSLLRWFDKSFTLISYPNGKMGINAEHSWADAPIVGHMWEVNIMTALHLIQKQVLIKYFTILSACSMSYQQTASTSATQRKDIVKGTWTKACRIPAGYSGRFQWRYTPAFHPSLLWPDANKATLAEHTFPFFTPWQCKSIIEASYVSAKQIADDVDFYGCLFHEFGKGLIKKCRTSPDAFIQMALQLAQFRVRARASHHPYMRNGAEIVFSLSVLSSNVTKCFQPDSPAGPRTVLFDLRVVDDPYVQRRADRDGTFLHVGGRRVRQSHGEHRLDCKLLSIVFHTLQQMKVELGGGACCEWMSVTMSHCPGLWTLWCSYPVKLTLTATQGHPGLCLRSECPATRSVSEGSK